MSAYTEQQIRGLAINFLRFHYKLRPRFAGGGTRIIDKPHYYQGVLIDARLAYQRPDRSFFTATLEATSLDTQDEILYQVNYWRVVIHAFVITLALAAIVVWGLTLFPPYFFDAESAAIVEESNWAGTRVQGFNLWRAFGRPDVYWVLIYSFLLTFGIIGVLLSRWRVYRYIYAVDQFKHFYADAQWVAYDVKIFESDSRRIRRRYRELHRQCVQWGFGLLAVEADSVVRNVISPSQIDQFGGDRIKLPTWISNIEVAPTQLRGMLRGGKKKPGLAPAQSPPPDEAVDPLDVGPYLNLPARIEESEAAVIPKARPGRPKIYERPARRWKYLLARTRRYYRSLYPSELRRRPGYYDLGGWVFALGIPAAIALSVGLYQQSQYEPIAEVGEAEAVPNLDGLESVNNPAPPLEIEEGEYQRTIDMPLSDPELRPNVGPDALVAIEEIENIEELQRYRVGANGEVLTDYACVPLYELESKIFLLVFGRYPSFGEARRWGEELNRLYRLPVTVARNSCVELSADDGWILYVDSPTTDEGEANLMARNFMRDSSIEFEIIEIN